jgi:amino acid transporter
MERNGYFPHMFGKLHPLYGVPRQAMWFNLIISFIFLFMFRGWGTLAEVISVATLISYVTGPVSVMAFRNIKDDTLNRPLMIKGMSIIAPIAFIVASLILYWAKWPLTGEVTLIMALGLPIYFYYQAKNKWQGFGVNFKAGLWLLIYLIFMIVVSYLGSDKFGGINVIHYGWDMLFISVSSLIFYFWGIKSTLPSYRAVSDESTEQSVKIK